MSPALAQEKLYTVDDIYSLPDGQRAELVDGQIYHMAPPSRKHQEISGELFGIIREYIKSKNGSCRPYIAPFAVFLDENDRNYVEPDISVICDPDKLNDKGCCGAPDWIIEIVSPGSRRMDYFQNFLNTALPVCVNTGSWIQTETVLLYTISRQRIPRTILFPAQ